jgi:uncharacterized protein (TIGR02001 family)
VKKTLLAMTATLALTALPSVSFAEDSPLSFNVSVTTDYRYRGITHTRFKPVLQGGADYALPGGLYIGTLASTIKWIKDFDVKGSVGLDLYGGSKGEIQKDLGNGFSVSGAIVGTDADKNFYDPGPAANSTKFLG